MRAKGDSGPEGHLLAQTDGWSQWNKKPKGLSSKTNVCSNCYSLDSKQCSMEENCLAPEAYRLRRESPNFSMESRRLLRFTTNIENIGDADFRPFIPKIAWEWHACHMHYHSMEVCFTVSF